MRGDGYPNGYGHASSALADHTDADAGHAAVDKAGQAALPGAEVVQADALPGVPALQVVVVPLRPFHSGPKK